MGPHVRSAQGQLMWQEHAACRGADINVFFPERGGNVAEAKSYCARCKVKAECLAECLSMPLHDAVYGVWAGLSGRERRRQHTARWRFRMCVWCESTPVPGPQHRYCSPECKEAGVLANRMRRAAKRAG